MSARPVYPFRDIALLIEQGSRVAHAIRQETAHEIRRRGKAIRSRAREAMGLPTPPPPAPNKKAALVVAPRKLVAVPTANAIVVKERQRPRPVPGEALCHPCLLEDAKQRDEWARRLATKGLHGAATREAREAERLRVLIEVSVAKACRLHGGSRRRGQRQAPPEPTVRPPGIFELAMAERAVAE